jgi:hypothetical protein
MPCPNQASLAPRRWIGNRGVILATMVVRLALPDFGAIVCALSCKRRTAQLGAFPTSRRRDIGKDLPVFMVEDRCAWHRNLYTLVQCHGGGTFASTNWLFRTRVGSRFSAAQFASLTNQIAEAIQFLETAVCFIGFATNQTNVGKHDLPYDPRHCSRHPKNGRVWIPCGMLSRLLGEHTGGMPFRESLFRIVKAGLPVCHRGRLFVGFTVCGRDPQCRIRNDFIVHPLTLMCMPDFRLSNGI